MLYALHFDPCSQVIAVEGINNYNGILTPSTIYDEVRLSSVHFIVTYSTWQLSSLKSIKSGSHPFKHSCSSVMVITNQVTECWRLLHWSNFRKPIWLAQSNKKNVLLVPNVAVLCEYMSMSSWRLYGACVPNLILYMCFRPALACFRSREISSTQHHPMAVTTSLSFLQGVFPPLPTRNTRTITGEPSCTHYKWAQPFILILLLAFHHWPFAMWHIACG